MTTEKQTERRVIMPDGRRESDHYNARWCKERHEKIDQDIKNIRLDKEKEFIKVWDAIRRQSNMLWGIMGLQLTILGGIIAILATG